MSVATLLEAATGVLGGGIGLVGLSLSWYCQSRVYDIGASLVMGSLVSGVSYFLLQRTQAALLGRALPEHLVMNLSTQPSNPRVLGMGITVIPDGGIEGSSNIGHISKMLPNIIFLILISFWG